jgi:hypothetical protein
VSGVASLHFPYTSSGNRLPDRRLTHGPSHPCEPSERLIEPSQGQGTSLSGSILDTPCFGPIGGRSTANVRPTFLICRKRHVRNLQC